MKRNKAVRYALVLAGLLSLTGCKEEENIPYQKKEPKVEQIQKQTNRSLYDEDRKQVDRPNNETKAQNETRTKSDTLQDPFSETLRRWDTLWDELQKLGVPMDTLYNVAERKKLYVAPCHLDPEKCDGLHAPADPHPHLPILSSLEGKVRVHLPIYDKLPLEVKAVVLQTQLLAKDGLKSFPKMTAALKRNDFSKAAQESAIRGYPGANPFRKKVLQNAASKTILRKSISRKIH